MSQIEEFQKTVWNFYKVSGRHDLPWRQPEADGAFDPYKIVVSEIMLQQTQVSRVIPKFHEFLKIFPTVQALSKAPLGDVILAWSGLGYNRRAKFLWQAAQAIASDHNGVIPATKEDLVKLPGIGVNTAGAILAYAYNQPAVFVETNIRTVLIHHFFGDESDITDAALADLVLATLPVERSPSNGTALSSSPLARAETAVPLDGDLPPQDYRTWYWALMDYGTYLKQTVGNLSARSKTFTKQTAFIGSKRQIRGNILKLLGSGKLTKAQLVKQIADERILSVLDDLTKEGLILRQEHIYKLP